MFASVDAQGNRTLKDGVTRVVGAMNAKSGGLDVHLKVGEDHAGSTLYTRGYIIISVNGEIKIIYTDLYQVSYNGLATATPYKRIITSTKDPTYQ